MSEHLLESLIWDNHACMPLRPGDVTFLGRLTDVHAAGIDVLSLNVSTGKQTYQFAISVLETYRTWIEERSDRFLIVSSAADAMLAHATNRLGVCFDVEGADVARPRCKDFRFLGRGILAQLDRVIAPA